MAGFIERWLEEKLNPAQTAISQGEGSTVSSDNNPVPFYTYYDNLEIVNRAVNMITDDVAEVRCIVGAQTQNMAVAKGIRAKTVNKLLNVEPNPYQDINTFKRNLVLDYLLDGNIFIYFDGVFLYHLPAAKIVIVPDPKTYVEKYTYDGRIDYSPEEIIHIKENSFRSLYRGTSRLKPALRTMKLLTSMRSFQDNFFKNGAIPGLVIKSPNTLSEKIKDRMTQSWTQRFKPDGGGRRPLILDGGMELDDISKFNFKEMDFQGSITANENTLLKALGIPPIMMDSGNNANIRPNHRMYYLETIIPIVRKLNFAFERYFGYEIKEDVANVPALQPELQELGAYLVGLKNGGIITGNEARKDIGKEPIEGNDEIIHPANVAGSAANPGTGGRPKEGKE